MTSESGIPFGGRRWTLLLGPGETLEELTPLLEALLPLADAGERPKLQQLEDLGDLFCAFPESGRLVLDVETLSREEVGLVRRFLDRHPRWWLSLLAEDPTERAALLLLRLDRVEWLPAPIDVEALRELVLLPAAIESPPSRTAAPLAPAAVEVEEDEAPPAEVEEEGDDDDRPEDAPLPVSLLERIQRVLDGEPLAALSAEAVSAGIEDVEESAELEGASPEAPAPPPLAVALTESRVVPPFPPPPAYFRSQVADLADLVQCVSLELDRARDEAIRDGAVTAAAEARRLENLAAQVARLRHFTQTLSYLAAPPPVGNQLIDLEPLLQEMLSSRRGEPDAPRYLLRSSGSLVIRSDKRLLTQALDAILFLSHHGAGPNGTVRVDARADEASVADVRGSIHVSIRFPAGPVRDVEPERIREPYALRRVLPELGANALAAAGGILAGQGGSLDLRIERGGGLEWLVRLPRGRSD